MTRFLPILAVTLTLAACGADGPPVPPAQAAAEPGLALSGSVGLGVVSR